MSKSWKRDGIRAMAAAGTLRDAIPDRSNVPPSSPTVAEQAAAEDPAERRERDRANIERQVFQEARANRTVQCPADDCSARVIRIERYHVTVEWELSATGWDLGTHDTGTHFHLFCEDGHETKQWGNKLAKRLQRVVYPGGNS